MAKSLIRGPKSVDDDLHRGPGAARAGGIRDRIKQDKGQHAADDGVLHHRLAALLARKFIEWIHLNCFICVTVLNTKDVLPAWLREMVAMASLPLPLKISTLLFRPRAASASSGELSCFNW